MNFYLVGVLVCWFCSLQVFVAINDRNRHRSPHGTDDCLLAAHPDPKRFIEYKPYGGLVVKKCDEGLIFSSNQCSCNWSRTMGCDKRPSHLGTAYFEQKVNIGWLTKACFPGSVYNSATCDCVARIA